MEKSRIQQLREGKLQLRVDCLMPLPAVLSMAVDSIVLSARRGRETCMPRVSLQSGVGQRKGVVYGVCVKGEVGRVVISGMACHIHFFTLPGIEVFPWSEGERELPFSALISQ